MNRRKARKIVIKWGAWVPVGWDFISNVENVTYFACQNTRIKQSTFYEACKIIYGSKCMYSFPEIITGITL
jgi:hypothetical protein